MISNTIHWSMSLNWRTLMVNDCLRKGCLLLRVSFMGLLRDASLSSQPARTCCTVQSGFPLENNALQIFLSFVVQSYFSDYTNQFLTLGLLSKHNTADNQDQHLWLHWQFLNGFHLWDAMTLWSMVPLGAWFFSWSHKLLFFFLSCLLMD